MRHELACFAHLDVSVSPIAANQGGLFSWSLIDLITWDVCPVGSPRRRRHDHGQHHAHHDHERSECDISQGRRDQAQPPDARTRGGHRNTRSFAVLDQGYLANGISIGNAPYFFQIYEEEQGTDVFHVLYAQSYTSTEHEPCMGCGVLDCQHMPNPSGSNTNLLRRLEVLYYCSTVLYSRFVAFFSGSGRLLYAVLRLQASNGQRYPKNKSRSVGFVHVQVRRKTDHSLGQCEMR